MMLSEKLLQRIAAILTALLMCTCTSAFAQPSERLVLQLEWEHEFQFAGYYAAQWQGYYSDEGLDVEIRSAFSPEGESVSPAAELLQGSANFAVGGLDALLGRAQGKPFIALSPIFQRSPEVAFALASVPIDTVAQFSKLRIAAKADELIGIKVQSLMFLAGIDKSNIQFVNAEPSVDSLVAGLADVIITYDVSANYRAQELGVELNAMRLDEHGVDFYGDTLYTTEDMIARDPETVERFVDASIRGWKYALENAEAIADRISAELPRYVHLYEDVRSYNRFFAQRINNYIHYPAVPLGQNQLERWYYAYLLLDQQGLVNRPFPISELYQYSAPVLDDQTESLPLWLFSAFLLLPLALVIVVYRSKFVIFMVFVALLYFVAEQLIENRYESMLVDQQRLDVSETLGNIRYQLESQLSNNLSLINGLAAFIAANPNYSNEAFNTYSAAIIAREPSLANLAAAPDLIISNIYPFEGNEAALGLDYRLSAEQYPAIQRLIQAESMVVAGPVTLVQGGSAFIGRAPVYIEENDGTKTFWGIVSAPILESIMYSGSDLLSAKLGLDVAIRGRDGLGSDGEVFYGRSEVFNNPRVVALPVVIGGGSWQIGAVAYQDILNSNTSIFLLRLGAMLTAVLTLIALYFRHKVMLRERRYEQLIIRNEQFLREVEEVSKVGGWRLGANGVFTEMSGQCLQILGLSTDSRNTTLDQICELFTPETREALFVIMNGSLDRDDDFDTEVRLTRNNGEEVWLHVRGEMAFLSLGRRELVGAIQDVTKAKEADSLIEYQANFDALTGLANRTLFRDRLEMAIGQSKRFSTKLAVLFIDLDNFKSVNDNLGHDVGDEVLIETSKRISLCVGPTGTVARYSGDEFIVLLNNVFSESDICRAAEAIVAKVAEPFLLDMHQVYCGVSIGIAFYPNDAQDSDTLIIKADQAMYEVKKSGRNGWQFYTEEMQLKSERRHNLFHDLVDAVNASALDVYYQPIVCPYSGRVAGCEALVRWQRDDGSFVFPDEFIPVAEESGLIIRIDYFVLCRAKAFISSLNTELGLNLNLSINVSARMLHMRDESAQVWFNEVKKPSNVPISVEITERVLVEDAIRARNVMDELNSAGIRISIDDFGTGYSSLSYLSRFPVQCMKIDRSFIVKIGQLKTEEALIETMLLMAEKLNISVIAEGVETEEQLAFLKNAHCDLVQGYYLGKPMPESAFKEFLINAAAS
jgi:diguanylate cyclase (GGDEF)-like protein/PAS domain S-box-containing protein